MKREFNLIQSFESLFPVQKKRKKAGLRPKSGPTPHTESPLFLLALQVQREKRRADEAEQRYSKLLSIVRDSVSTAGFSRGGRCSNCGYRVYDANTWAAVRLGIRVRSGARCGSARKAAAGGPIVVY